MVMEPYVPACARRDIVDNVQVGVYHCIARCVRRAFLCGIDTYSGRDYSHRKAWVLDRLRHLAGLFGVEVCGYAIMSNHLHLVLQNRPDSVEQWSDAEVALRWRKLFPLRDEASGKPAEPDDCDLAMLTADADRLKILRQRLSSLSWFMRCLCEWVARAANVEDGSAGRFWAGRFKSQPLLDEAALLACSVWTGRELRRDKRGAIPDDLAPILDRLGVDRANWVQTVRDFGRLFKQVVGRASSLVSAAPRCSRRWFQGKAAARVAFL
jgi:REP element-mobilizing transposase RayT